MIPAAFASTIIEREGSVVVPGSLRSASWERLHGQPRMGIEAADRIATVLV